jgi:hypothetical protein
MSLKPAASAPSSSLVLGSTRADRSPPCSCDTGACSPHRFQHEVVAHHHQHRRRQRAQHQQPHLQQVQQRGVARQVHLDRLHQGVDALHQVYRGLVHRGGRLHRHRALVQLAQLTPRPARTSW